ncbi:MAG: hypothetical protein ACI9P8_000306 [Bacteroidia bacterium]|jgi:hypothetical protein
MKIFNYIILGALSSLIACSGNHEGHDHSHEHEGHDHESEAEETAAEWFGDEFKMVETHTVAELPDLIKAGSGSVVTVKGEIGAACQKKGCWMTMAEGETEMRVRFLDYGFFVPKDCAGRIATIQGVASFDTITVDVLQHYAEDAGDSEEEIAKITEPEYELSFEATGVLIE